MLKPIEKKTDGNSLNDCYHKIQKGICNDVNPTECISKIVYLDFDRKSKVMGKSPLNIKYIMLPNIIFIIYLQYNDDNDDNDSDFNLLKKRQEMIEKMDKNNMNQSNTNNTNNTNNAKNTNKKINIERYFSSNDEPLFENETKIKQEIQIIKERKRLEEEEEKIRREVSSVNINSNNKNAAKKITDRDVIHLLNEFKSKSLDEKPMKNNEINNKNFIVWYCQWKNNISSLYEDAKKITKIINDRKMLNNVENRDNNNFYTNRLKELSDPLFNKNIFENNYKYLLIFSLLIQRLSKTNKTIYNSIYNDYQNLNNFIKQINMFNEGKSLANPFTQFYTNFNSIVNNNANSFSKSLDNIYYFRYLVNLIKSNKTERLTLSEVLDKFQSQFIMMDVMNLPKTLDLNVTKKLKSNNILPSRRGQMYTWISNDGYLVTTCQSKGRGKYVIKTIGQRLTKNDSFSISKYNKESVNLSSVTIGTIWEKIIGSNKIVDIKCGNDNIQIYKNKIGSLTISRSPNSLYSSEYDMYCLIYDDKKYKIKSVCAEGATKNSPITIAEYYSSSENNKNIEQNLTILQAKPFEVMMILTIGYAIRFNYGKLFDKLSNESDLKIVDCNEYKKLY